MELMFRNKSKKMILFSMAVACLLSLPSLLVAKELQ